MTADGLLDQAAALLRGPSPRDAKTAAWLLDLEAFRERRATVDHRLPADPEDARLARAVGDVFAASVRTGHLPTSIHNAIADLGGYIDELCPGYLLDRIADEIQTNGPFPLDNFPGAPR